MKNIVIPPDIRSHWIWQDSAKFQWWIDMLMCSLEPDCTISVSGNDVHRKEGQIADTLTGLAKRWNTKKDTVRYFLSKLESDKIIQMDNTKKYSLITILVLDHFTYVPISTSSTSTKSEQPLKVVEAEEIKSSPKKRKPRKAQTEPTLITKARLLFERIHHERSSEIMIPEEKQQEGSYYWEAKDATNMKQLLKKIAYSRTHREKPLPVDDDSLVVALESFLQAINDSWILQHFTVPILNSQYNSIITTLKQKKNAIQQSPRTSGPRTSALDVDSQKRDLYSDLSKIQSEWEAKKRTGFDTEQGLLPG
ncbi:hypothetical protein [Bacteroides acidifaciens]|jgi:hypothetical protein|uniref:hypothetical protein n=1 Tax=Bacteroides acidifaciens TaxID=85831 RepID=UPI0025710B4B|nr:hypothetical protein [Bacteroides acidifaciens]